MDWNLVIDSSNSDIEEVFSGLDKIVRDRRNLLGQERENETNKEGVIWLFFQQIHWLLRRLTKLWKTIYR